MSICLLVIGQIDLFVLKFLSLFVLLRTFRTKRFSCVLRYSLSISVYTSAIHQALPFYVLKELGLVAGMHTAKEYSMGLTLQFTDLPSLKSESAIRQSVGFLRTAKHVIKDGKDQMAPLIESDENRELFQKLAQAISNIPGTGTMAIAEK